MRSFSYCDLDIFLTNRKRFAESDMHINALNNFFFSTERLLYIVLLPVIFPRVSDLIELKSVSCERVYFLLS